MVQAQQIWSSAPGFYNAQHAMVRTVCRLTNTNATHSCNLEVSHGYTSYKECDADASHIDMHIASLLMWLCCSLEHTKLTLPSLAQALHRQVSECTWVIDEEVKPLSQVQLPLAVNGSMSRRQPVGTMICPWLETWLFPVITGQNGSSQLDTIVC